MQQVNSTSYTLRVAVILCFVCSLGVSAAAVILKPYQEANEKLNQQKNILDATGLALGEYGRPAEELDRRQIKELYGWISEKLVTLETGEYNTEEDITKFDAREAAKKPGESIEILNPQFDPGENRRAKVAKVYFVTRPKDSKITQVVLPVHGKGLWGTLWGYLAIKSDLETVQGLTFYEHKETPGLGGEVDSARFKSQWRGRKLFDPKGVPAAMVFKGPAPADNPYAVDGLSGATITSRGVTNLIRYWVSDDGYGPFLKRLKAELEGDQPSSDKEAGADNDGN
ncbi:MAG: Na(+)-translocating NADH-quinone reductase subunit C [Pirellulales bacterium]|nr:Na(+)-translocating NADH-quinone reductase subunit C [Pirellulales bacterium]